MGLSEDRRLERLDLWKHICGQGLTSEHSSDVPNIRLKQVDLRAGIAEIHGWDEIRNDVHHIRQFHDDCRTESINCGSSPSITWKVVSYYFNILKVSRYNQKWDTANNMAASAI